jgi:hypothetical protein
MKEVETHLLLPASFGTAFEGNAWTFDNIDVQIKKDAEVVNHLFHGREGIKAHMGGNYIVNLLEKIT